MKKGLLIVGFFVIAFTQRNIAQETGKNELPQLLSDYYNLKNALVAGNSSVASAKATDIIKVLNGIENKFISEEDINTLLKDAGKISVSTDIKKQREYFSNFSNNMIAVAKAVKLSDKEVYIQYCSMKKASWLSSEKAIKNPYYGSSMLTCGQVTETLK